jgi:porin
VGAWQQGNGTWRKDGTLVRNHGVYAAADHRLSAREEGGGPAVFARWSWSPGDRNEITGYAGGGFLYEGLTSRRPDDSAGIGVNVVRQGRQVGSETAYELFYRYQVTRNVILQPDVQWLRHIAGQRPSTLVAGLRMGIEF